jgi:hypothetical protein
VSRVQCLDCGIAVVVDPRGICPEGHVVGSAGVRVANAMGGGSPHPDEPEPWVATVVLDEADARPAPRQRSIRPVPVLGPEEPTEDTEAADHEAMLRELHALGDLHDTAPAAPAALAPAPAASTPAPSTPAASTPPDTSPAPPREQFAEGLAELSALEAAFQALGHDETPAPTPDPAPVAEPTAVAAEVTPAPAVTSAPPAADASSPAAHPVTAAYDELVDYEDLFAADAPSAPTGDRSAASSSQNPASPAPPSQVSPSQVSPPQVSPPQVSPPQAPPLAVTAPMAAMPPSAPAAAAPQAVAPPLGRGATPDAPVDAYPSPDPADPAPTEPEAEAEVEVPPAAAARGLDLANFTANGAKVGAGRGGRRKLFGR